jgi:hypothetical protein
MGASWGKKYASPWDDPWQTGHLPFPVMRYRGAFEALGLSPREVTPLYKLFMSKDLTKSGVVSFEETLHVATHDKMGVTPAMARSLSCMNPYTNDKLNLRAFVGWCWEICTADEGGLAYSLFDMYDSGAHYLTLSQFQGMVDDLYPPDRHGVRPEQEALLKSRIALTAFRGTMSGMIGQDDKNEAMLDLPVFLQFAQRNPALVYPLCQMRELVRKHVVNAAFWLALQKFRQRRFPADKYATAFKLLHGVPLEEGGQTPPLRSSQRRLSFVPEDVPLKASWALAQPGGGAGFVRAAAAAAAAAARPGVKFDESAATHKLAGTIAQHMQGGGEDEEDEDIDDDVRASVRACARACERACERARSVCVDCHAMPSVRTRTCPARGPAPSFLPC